MTLFKAARTSLWTLPQDMTVAAKIVTAKKLDTCAILVAVLALTLFMNLLIMMAVTRSLPGVTMNTKYFGMTARRLSSATSKDLPGALLGIARSYWEYPAVWFDFQRISVREQIRTLAEDTTVAFPVINIRYLAEATPVALLLAVYTVLFRHGRRTFRVREKHHLAPLVSISVPGGTGAMGSLIAPMACCGGAAVQATASIIGFGATATAGIVLSRISMMGVVALLIVSIARTARKINRGCRQAS